MIKDIIEIAVLQKGTALFLRKTIDNLPFHMV